MARALPAAVPVLHARPKPALVAFSMSRTCGNFCATIAGEPSLDALSTTMTSSAMLSLPAPSAARQRARCSRVFQLTMTTSTSALTLALRG